MCISHIYLNSALILQIDVQSDYAEEEDGPEEILNTASQENDLFGNGQGGTNAHEEVAGMSKSICDEDSTVWKQLY